MKTIGFLVLTLLTTGVFAQGKLVANKFKLPANATASDYQSGVLLAKLKPAYRNLATATSGGRVASLQNAVIKPISNSLLVKQTLASRGPRVSNESGIDLSLYVKIFFDQSTDVEKKINELYASGYFEIIEPNYGAKINFTPNDPALSQQYYINTIHAIEAWDISKSDGQTVIAIVDSGGDLDHPDLASKLYVNPDEIANNNIDDDSDGFIDNVSGWDFVGADTLNLFNSSFIGDNDPQLKLSGSGGELVHGVWVAGCAGAATNNGIGVAGVGFNAKILFTKHTADNQNPNRGNIYFGYDGILYAAQTLTADNVPRKIINCSWAGSFRSQIAQDLITHVTIDLGCLVVGAAGNAGTPDANYPAAYDYVLSVGATDASDVKASFSSYGTTLDVTAPGVGIVTTAYNDAYASVGGTSFSSPITSGAAALVWSHFPNFTPVQVAEQLRVSSDNIDSNNAGFVNQLGRGRINVNSAMTANLPSVRASKPTVLNSQGSEVAIGQNGFLTMDFTNYLAATSGALAVTASSSSSFLTFSTNQITLGSIANGATIRNASNPFKLNVSASTPENTSVQIKLTYTDGSFTDFQFIELSINPSFLTIDENTISTTISSIGRIGYDDPANQANGVGFVFNDNSVLYEMGLMMANSSSNLFNNVRGTGTNFDQDFVKVQSISKRTPGLRTTSEIIGSFSPTALSTLTISYTSLVLRDAPNDKFIIMEYVLKNSGTAAISNFRVGLFADWDISDSGAKDAAGWDDAHKIGYVFPKQSTSLPHAGIQVLTGNANYYAIDNDGTIAGNPFGLYDGFSDTEKFTTLSTQRLAAGTTTPTGNDVSHVVSVAPVNIPVGGQVTLAFALHVANNLDELLASADAANTLYNTVFNLPKPVVAVTNACYGSPATITATGASNYKWYKFPTGGTALQTGPQITTTNLFADTTLYVSNTDNPTYESVRTPALVSIKANPNIVSTSTQFCQGGTIVLSVNTADEYLWSNGQTTQNITVGTAGDYSVRVKYNALSCVATSTPVSVSSLPSPTVAFTSSGSPYTGKLVSFTDQSPSATGWSWNFGDGSTLGLIQNPTHTYFTAQSYSVALTITAGNGCTATLTKPLDIITGLEDYSAEEFSVYPNPTSQRLNFQLPFKSQTVALSVINMSGQTVKNTMVSLDDKGQSELLVGDFSEGLYLFRVNAKDQSLLFKVEIKR